VGAARGRAGGRGAAGGGKGRLNFLYSLFLELTIGIIACIEAVLAISPVVTFRKELAILIVVLYQARHHPELIGLVNLLLTILVVPTLSR
jgi:hypothetical protein